MSSTVGQIEDTGKLHSWPQKYIMFSCILLFICLVNNLYLDNSFKRELCYFKKLRATLNIENIVKNLFCEFILCGGRVGKIVRNNSYILVTDIIL